MEYSRPRKESKTALVEKAEPSGLRFNSNDDAISYADKVVEEFKRRLVENKVPNVIEAYRRVQLEIVVRLRPAASNPADLYLVFRANPRYFFDQNAGTFVDEFAREENRANEIFMFTDVGKLVESPEGVIPSFVWLKSRHQIKDFLGDIFGSIFSTTLDIGRGFSEREMSVLAGLSGRDSNCVTELIECSPKVLDRIERQPGDSQRQRLNQPDVLEIVSFIKWVWLSENSVRLTLKEGFCENFNFVDVRLGVLDGETRAC
jgi:hypothetical protein